jgi:hypothetical protein
MRKETQMPYFTDSHCPVEADVRRENDEDQGEGCDAQAETLECPECSTRYQGIRLLDMWCGNACRNASADRRWKLDMDRIKACAGYLRAMEWA